MAHEIIYKILQVKLNKNLLDIPTYSGQNFVIIKRIARLKLLKAVLHAKNWSLWNAPTVTYWNIFNDKIRKSEDKIMSTHFR